MNGHDLHSTFSCSGKIHLSVIHLILLQFLDIPYKIKQTTITCLLVFHGFFHQHVQVCTSLCAIWHSLCMVSISGTFQHFQDQLVDRRICSHIPESVHCVPKTGQFLSQSFFLLLKNPVFPIILHKCPHTFTDHSLRICDPKLCQLLCGASHNGRTKHTGQRNILKRIIQHPEIIQKCNNLCCGKISGSGRRIGRNPSCSQHFPKSLCPSGGRAEQDHNISIPYRTVLPGFLVKHKVMSHHGTDFSCNGQSLQLPFIFRCVHIGILQDLPVFFHKKNLSLYEFAILSLRKRGSRIQSSRLIIINSTQIRSHDLSENKVDTFQNFLSASEIFVKIDPLLQAVCQRIAFVLLHKQLRTSQSEPVNTLLHISYHKDIFTVIHPAGNILHQDFLNQVAVLIFIQKNLIVFLGKFPCCLAWRTDISFFFQKDLQGKMFHV